jgi:hypothetical protein
MPYPQGRTRAEDTAIKATAAAHSRAYRERMCDEDALVALHGEGGVMDDTIGIARYLRATERVSRGRGAPRPRRAAPPT